MRDSSVSPGWRAVLTALLLLLVLAAPVAAAQVISGPVQALPPSGGVGTWVVNGVAVQVTPATRLKFKRPVMVGRYVRVKGYYAGGTFFATEIKGKKRYRW